MGMPMPMPCPQCSDARVAVSARTRHERLHEQRICSSGSCIEQSLPPHAASRRHLRRLDGLILLEAPDALDSCGVQGWDDREVVRRRGTSKHERVEEPVVCSGRAPLEADTEERRCTCMSGRGWRTIGHGATHARSVGQWPKRPEQHDPMS